MEESTMSATLSAADVTVKTNDDGTAEVLIAGRGTLVEVKLSESSTVEGVLANALVQVGAAREAAANLSAVLNGRDAEPSDKVSPGDRIAAAGNVNNG
jgi:hypothetical protein